MPSVITLIDPPLITPGGATPLNTQAISTGPEIRKEKKGFFSKFKKSLKHPDETEELIPTPSTSPEGATKMIIRKSHDNSVTCFYSAYIKTHVDLFPCNKYSAIVELVSTSSYTILQSHLFI